MITLQNRYLRKKNRNVPLTFLISITAVCIDQIEASKSPPEQPPGDLTFLKIIVQIPPSPSQNAVQMPHIRIHSGDQMPLPRGHFTGTEGRKKRLQLSNKIRINTANSSHSI